MALIPSTNIGPYNPKLNVQCEIEQKNESQPEPGPRDQSCLDLFGTKGTRDKPLDVNLPLDPLLFELGRECHDNKHIVVAEGFLVVFFCPRRFLNLISVLNVRVWHLGETLAVVTTMVRNRRDLSETLLGTKALPQLPKPGKLI